MSLTDDVTKLLRSLYAWERAREAAKGRPGQFNSKDAARLLCWEAARLNRAVNVLEKRRLIEVDESLGSAPFSTHGFQLNEDGWLECERLGLDGAVEQNRVEETTAEVGAVLPAADQAILNLIAEYQFAEGESTPLAHVLLAGDERDEDSLRQRVRFLIGRQCVEMAGALGHETLDLTPTGVLLCKFASTCDAFVIKLLTYFQTRLKAEGVKFKEYTWDQLKTGGVVPGDSAFPMVSITLRVFNLYRASSESKGPPPTAQWTVPTNIVKLRSANSLSDLYLLMKFATTLVAASEGQADQSVPAPSRPRETRGATVSLERKPTRNELASGDVDFAILTAIEVERRAVCAALEFGESSRTKRDGRWYWRGRLQLPGGAYEIVVAQPVEMGQVEAALLASDVIRHWQPRAALLVGIAASATPADVALGDIVVGQSVWYYEHGKITPSGPKPQPEMIVGDSGLLKHLVGMADWDGELPMGRPDGANRSPKVQKGVIASGEKVIADAVVRDQLIGGHRKILAIEMEGYGFSRAVWQNFTHVAHLVIRGICDDGSVMKNDTWHAYAAAAAASFTKHFLQDAPLTIRQQAVRAAPDDPAERLVADRYSSGSHVVRLTKDEQRVLDVFARFQIGAEEHLPDGSFNHHAYEFPPPLRQRLEDVLTSMIERGLLRRAQNGYILTALAAELLYEEG